MSRQSTCYISVDFICLQIRRSRSTSSRRQPKQWPCPFSLWPWKTSISFRFCSPKSLATLVITLFGVSTGPSMTDFCKHNKFYGSASWLGMFHHWINSWPLKAMCRPHKSSVDWETREEQVFCVGCAEIFYQWPTKKRCDSPLASMWLWGLFPSASGHKGTFVQIRDNQGGATWQTGIFNEHLAPRGVSCFSWSFLSQRVTCGPIATGSVQEGVSSFENLQLSRDLSHYPQRQLTGPSCYSRQESLSRPQDNMMMGAVFP